MPLTADNRAGGPAVLNDKANNIWSLAMPKQLPRIALCLMASMACGQLIPASASAAGLARKHHKSALKKAIPAPLAVLTTGSVLHNVKGTLVMPSGQRYPEFRFLHRKKNWPESIRLLPCMALQAMEQLHQPHIGFVLSGMLSQYHHHLYLLPDADVRLLRKQVAKRPSSTQPTTTGPITPSMAGRTSAQNVLNNLLAHHISRPVEQLVQIKPMRFARAIPDLPQPAGVRQNAALPEGSYIWNRPGRLLFNGPLHEWIFIFQADNSHSSASPLIMLPCQLLERMEDRSSHGGTEIEFRISGRITQFNGRNYIFTTYENVAHNLGRF
jgi:hypothetical protein